MSGYNNNNYINQNNSASNSSHMNFAINSDSNKINQNGHQAPFTHTENDFMNRNFSSTSQSEMSVQLTRPTSKTALLVRQRRAMLEQLSCFICKGYLIDATTIDECMDSFCKSCIVIHLSCNNNCPKCGASIQNPDPFDSIRSDKVLQDIIYKLIPGLYDDEMRRRREFYKGLCGSSSSSSDDDDDSSSTLSEPISGLTGEKYGVVSHPKPFYKPSDNVDLSIEPQTRGDRSTIYYDNKRQSIVTCFTGNSSQREPLVGSWFSSVDIQHFKTYLRCPARLTVIQLKKFIAAKFNTCKDDTIHLLYLNESLKDEYSLIDVAYIYDWRGIEHMRLFYIIERDLSNMSSEVNVKNGGPSRPTKVTRQSIGISTQTIKRVCIDPQPKYYEARETKSTETNLVGRSMRPRIDSRQSNVKPTQVTQTASTRTTQARDSITSSNVKITNSNGFMNHQLAGSSSAGRNMPPSYATSISNQSSKTSKPYEAKETRSQVNLRDSRNTEASPSFSIPKMNISLSTLNKSTAHSAANDSDSKAKNKPVESDYNKNNIVAIPQNNLTQLVPYGTKHFPNDFSGTTQSSLVTLASFSDSRRNHVVSTMSSSSTTATTISNNQKEFVANSTVVERQESTKSNDQRDNSNKNHQSTPQLAFSIVTERGITIVRRLNNQSESPNGPLSGSMPGVVSNKSANYPAQPTSSRSIGNTSNGQVSRFSSSIQGSTAGPSQANRMTDSASLNSNHRISGESVPPRHQIKVKPVYKTFVDPTKLKSPNLKKLGFTARH